MIFTRPRARSRPRPRFIFPGGPPPRPRSVPRKFLPLTRSLCVNAKIRKQLGRLRNEWRKILGLAAVNAALEPVARRENPEPPNLEHELRGESSRPRMYEPDWLAQARQQVADELQRVIQQRRAVQAELEEVEEQLSEVRARVEQARLNLEIEVARRVRQIVLNGRALMSTGGPGTDPDAKSDRARRVDWLRAALRRYLKRRTDFPPRHAFRGRSG